MNPTSEIRYKTLDAQATRMWRGMVCAMLMVSAAVWAITPWACAAGFSVTHTVEWAVSPIAVVSMTGTPNLTLPPPAPGQPTVEVVDSSCTYSLTTNCSAMRLVAAIDRDLPPGLTLEMAAAPPPGATGRTVSLTHGPQSVVTGISRVAAANLRIAYKLTAVATAGPVPATTRTVFLTLTEQGQ